jgi:hypothetical protein
MKSPAASTTPAAPAASPTFPNPREEPEAYLRLIASDQRIRFGQTAGCEMLDAIHAVFGENDRLKTSNQSAANALDRLLAERDALASQVATLRAALTESNAALMDMHKHARGMWAELLSQGFADSDAKMPCVNRNLASIEQTRAALAATAPKG